MNSTMLALLKVCNGLWIDYEIDTTTDSVVWKVYELGKSELAFTGADLEPLLDSLKALKLAELQADIAADGAKLQILEGT